MFCEKCGFQVRDQAAFCTRCGSPMDQNALNEKLNPAVNSNQITPENEIWLFCKQCGIQISPDDGFCGVCGARISDSSNAGYEAGIQKDQGMDFGTATQHVQNSETNTNIYPNAEENFTPELEIESVLERPSQNMQNNSYPPHNGMPNNEVYRVPYNEPVYDDYDESSYDGSDYDDSSDDDSKKDYKIILIVVGSILVVVLSIMVIILIRNGSKKDDSSQESTESFMTTSEQATETVMTTVDPEREAEESRALAEQARLESVASAAATVNELSDDGGMILDSTDQQSINMARSQVNDLEDSEEKEQLILELDFVQYLLDVRVSVTSLMQDGILDGNKKKSDLEAVLQKIEDLPEIQNTFKSKLRELYNQAQTQFDDNDAASTAVSELLELEVVGKSLTRADYDSAKELVDKVKNTELRQDLTKRLDMIDKAISEREEKAKEPTVPEGFDVEKGALHIQEVCVYVTENQSSMTATQLSNGAVWYEDEESGYAKMEVSAGGGDMTNYSRFYFYEDGKLIFAFYFRGPLEQQFYFTNEVMFRWIDENGTTRDLAYDHSSWRTWETEVKRVGVR